jgi:hypothetical protein
MASAPLRGARLRTPTTSWGKHQSTWTSFQISITD